jgi:hypothetical protein
VPLWRHQGMRFVCRLFRHDIVLLNNVVTDYIFSLLFVSFIQVYICHCLFFVIELTSVIQYCYFISRHTCICSSVYSDICDRKDSPNSNALEFYFGGTVFKSGPKHRLFWLKFVVSLGPLSPKSQESTPIKTWVRPSKSFLIHSALRSYIVCCMKASWNNWPKINCEVGHLGNRPSTMIGGIVYGTGKILMICILAICLICCPFAFHTVVLFKNSIYMLATQKNYRHYVSVTIKWNSIQPPAPYTVLTL